MGSPHPSVFIRVHRRICNTGTLRRCSTGDRRWLAEDEEDIRVSLEAERTGASIPFKDYLRSEGYTVRKVNGKFHIVKLPRSRQTAPPSPTAPAEASRPPTKP
jgi:hypothetical protein